MEKKPAVICDLDGCLAILEDRNPYDASTCENDLVNEVLKTELLRFKENGYSIILLTGREKVYEPQTLKWLEKNNIPWDELLMRENEDGVLAPAYKEVRLDFDILPNYEPYLAFEDQFRVAKMFRGRGIPCWLVNSEVWER